jgi:SAM-dependent methyltransferase
VLDVGCGNGWTSLFLAEAGFDVLGVDLVPCNIELARERAERWRSPARFAVADMEALNLGGRYDAALVFDALHHVALQTQALEAVGRHVVPGGWIVVGEPSWLHRLSPGARRTRRDLGWRERGLTVRGLRRDLRRAGCPTQRRFFQGTAPYEGLEVGSQLAWLIAARLFAAPRHHVWLAARRERPTG